MKRLIWLPAVILFVLLVAPVPDRPAFAKNSVQVTKFSIRVNDVNYRRKKAEEASLGSIGVRRGPSHAFFERKFEWIVGELEIDEPTTITLTTDMQKEFNLSAAVDLNKASASGSVGGGGSVSASYTLVKLSLADKFQAAEQVSKNSEIMGRLKQMDHPKDIRMITEVWILVKGTESQTSKFVGSASGGYKNVSGSGSYSSKSGATFSFSAGSVMAYTFDRMEFNHKHQKKWSKLENLKTDIYRR